MTFDDEDQTQPILVSGNNVFGRAIHALALAPAVGRAFLGEIFRRQGVATAAMSFAELARALPTIEIGLRSLLSDNDREASMARLRHLVDGRGGTRGHHD